MSSTKAAPLVYVCVLSWNKRKETLDCLRSVFDLRYPNFRVVVVDNGSSDGSADALIAMGDRIDLILLDKNLGYTGGCNRGIQHALASGAEYVWLLNNDAFSDPDALATLIDTVAPRPEVGLASPLVCFGRGGDDIQYCVGRLDVRTGEAEYVSDPCKGEVLQTQYPDQIQIIGTAMLIKRAVIEKIGLLDERFFAYFEDNDYCIRAAAAGFRAIVVTAARVYHDLEPQEKGMPQRKPYFYYYLVRNGVIFGNKYYSGLTRWKCLHRHMGVMIRTLARAGYGPAETAAFVDGAWCGFRGVTGEWRPDDPQHRMPKLLRSVLIFAPEFWLSLIEPNPRATLRSMSRLASRPFR